MDKVKTGIKGFDKLVDGGFPRGKSILLSGTPGTCKTIFALQFLHNGAMESKEKGLYISFEERTQSLKNQALQFGWDFDKLEKSGMVKIISIPPKSIKESTAAEIIKMANEGNIKRLVVDSLSVLSINAPTTYTKVSELTNISIKRFMYRFINDLRDSNSNITSLLISQTTNGQLSRDTVSEFICDGIIHISYESLGGDYSRSLIIRKMRETNNDEDVHPLEIGKNGLIVHDLK
ncbi:MAG: ATPase domain-containing protein [Nanoarchaeota archaeon]